MAISASFTQFSWVAPIYTRGIQVNKKSNCFSLVKIFFFFFFYYRRSRIKTQKGKVKIILSPLYSQKASGDFKTKIK